MLYCSKINVFFLAVESETKNNLLKSSYNRFIQREHEKGLLHRIGNREEKRNGWVVDTRLNWLINQPYNRIACMCYFIWYRNLIKTKSICSMFFFPSLLLLLSFSNQLINSSVSIRRWCEHCMRCVINIDTRPSSKMKRQLLFKIHLKRVKESKNDPFNTCDEARSRTFSNDVKCVVCQFRVSIFIFQSFVFFYKFALVVHQ